MSEHPRIAPVTPGSRPELAPIEQRIAAERGGIMLLYQVLLNSAPLAEGWERLLTAVRNKSSLPPALRELVILRVAVLNRAPYEFAQHEPVARKVGLAQAKIDAVRAATPGTALDETELAVLALADAMTRDVQVSDAVIAPVLARFDARGVVELVATIAAYNMVSRFLEALRIGH